MTIEKLPSGSYRIKQQSNGVRYSVTIDHKPTKAEAMRLISERLDDNPTKGTFESYAVRYIETKKNILSPATIRGYNAYLRQISEKLKRTALNSLTQATIQEEINRLSADHAPKTVRNIHGFISSVVKLYRPNLVLNTTLPQKEKKEPYIPTDTEVKAILEYAKGTKFEVPLWLAVYGLRRSEVLALTLSDLSENNVISVNKATVRGDDAFVTKKTKTTESTREIPINKELADLIRAQGYVYEGDASIILDFLHKAQKELGIKQFKLHALRHYFASFMSEIVSEEDVLALGGWSSPYVMKSVYRHSRIKDDEEAKRVAIEKMSTKLSTKS